MCKIGDFLKEDSDTYSRKREAAFFENKWFVPEYSFLAGRLISEQMLQEKTLLEFAEAYQIPEENSAKKKVGLIMAGNIPFVGFHDLLCIFLSGHAQLVKLSSKDTVLMRMILQVAAEFEPEVLQLITCSEMLKGCDAYIATGTDNSARYFEYYFSRYPHLIRKNRTSVAILNGRETDQQLQELADDIQLYFGLGCRNVTKIYVPEGYDFIPLLKALEKYDKYKDHDKYKNNYDYQLTIALLNKKQYMTNGSILLIEDDNPFSPISQLHYAYYKEPEQVVSSLDRDKIQCIVGEKHIPFGQAQKPGISDFPDGVDTMSFLMSL